MNQFKFILERLTEEQVKNSSNFLTNALTALVIGLLTIAQLFGIDTSNIDPGQIAILVPQIMVFIGNVWNIIVHLLNPKDKEIIPETL